MEDVEIVEGPLIGTLLRIPSSVVAEATERGLAAAGYEEVRAAHLPVLQPLFTRPEGARITDPARKCDPLGSKPFEDSTYGGAVAYASPWFLRA